MNENAAKILADAIAKECAENPLFCRKLLDLCPEKTGDATVDLIMEAIPRWYRLTFPQGTVDCFAMSGDDADKFAVNSGMTYSTPGHSWEGAFTREEVDIRKGQLKEDKIPYTDITGDEPVERYLET